MARVNTGAALKKAYSAVRQPTPMEFAQAYYDAMVAKAAETGERVKDDTDLTPSLAAILLEHNDKNRHLRHGDAIKYAKDILAGAWAHNDESIKISVSGRLIDGQHRCVAVVSAGKPIRTAITFGLPDEIGTTLDQGRTRSVNDYIKMEFGDAAAAEVSKALGLLWAYENKQPYHAGLTYTKHDILEMRHKHGDITESVAKVPSIPTKKPIKRHELIFLRYVLLHRGVSVDDIDRFIHLVVTADGVRVGEIVYLYRERLDRMGKKMNRQERVELLFRTWNAYRTGAELLRGPRMTGQVPELEG